MQWTKCSAGFYDPYFPNVCMNRTNPLSVGVTINSAWVATASNDPSVMVQTIGAQVLAFLNGTSRLLSLSRAPSQPQVSRVIGWREGLGDASVLPPAGMGIVNCPVEPCSVDSTSPNFYDPNFYYFAIDRVLPTYDGNVAYARYSFEVDFPAPGAYTLYFKGCCRPATFADLHNNYENGFYVRAGVVVTDELVPAVIPSASVRFQMPDEASTRAPARPARRDLVTAKGRDFITTRGRDMITSKGRDLTTTKGRDLITTNGLGRLITPPSRQGTGRSGADTRRTESTADAGRGTIRPVTRPRDSVT